MKFREYYILYLLFFLFGFNKALLYLPILMLVYLFKIPTLSNIKVKQTFIVLVFIYLCFLFSILFIGYDRLTVESPYKQFLSVIIPIIFGGLLFQYQDYKIKINLIGFYLFGIFFENFAIVLYSYLSDPIVYGYGKLISPFTNEEINSPLVSNMLSIVSTYFYIMLFYNKNNFFIKLISFTIFFICIISGVYLGGRTFFIILLITFLMHICHKLTLKNILKAISFIIIISIFVYIASINELEYYIELINKRFENGLESNRFLHYTHGFNMILQYPFGGFTIDTSIEDTKWFHNIFLDSARVAGWIPIIFLIIALLYSTKFLFYKKNSREDIIIPFSISIIVFLIMQQDVVVEGGIKSLIILFFTTYCLIDSKINKIRDKDKHNAQQYYKLR